MAWGRRLLMLNLFVNEMTDLRKTQNPKLVLVLSFRMAEHFYHQRRSGLTTYGQSALFAIVWELRWPWKPYAPTPPRSSCS